MQAVQIVVVAAVGQLNVAHPLKVIVAQAVHVDPARPKNPVLQLTIQVELVPVVHCG